MKNILLIFLVYFSFNHSSNAQTGYRLLYNLTYQIDSTDINSVRNELFYLDMFGNESYFISQNQFVMDSLTSLPNEKQALKEFLDLNTRPKNSKFKYTIKNSPTTLKFYQRVAQNHMTYQESSSLEWNLLEDTLRIENYLCQKATTYFAGREYTAWYTTEIPLMAFPYKFTGLLGTIIRIVDSKNHYQFDLEAISQTTKSNVYARIDNEKVIAKKDFLKAQKQYEDDPAAMLGSSGIVLSEEILERGKKNHELRKKRNNNPIELE